MDWPCEQRLLAGHNLAQVRDRGVIVVKSKGYFPCLLLVLLMVFCVPPRASGGESTRAEHHVLFIASYHPGFPTFFDQVEGLRQVFDQHDIRFDIEFMDAKRFVPGVSEPIFLDTLSRKLEVLPPYDLVITADDAALHFATRYHASLFSSRPIVFFGVNDVGFGLRVAADHTITGVLEEPSFSETVQLFQRLQGDEGALVVITDGSETAQIDTAQFVAEMARIRFSRYRIMSLQEYPAADILDTTSALRLPDALMVLSAYRDREGRVIRYEEFFASLRARTQVPVFHMWTHSMGLGKLGGKLVSHRAQAQRAAEMAARILSGTAISALPVVRDTGNEWLFDYNEMQRFGYAITDMPAGSRFLNQPDSLYERYRTYIGALLAFVAALFVIIASLIMRMRTRQAFERKLVDINRLLESKIELRTRALEQAHQDTENLLRIRNVILNNSLVGIVLIRDRRVEWVNGYAEILFGYSSDEVIGKQAGFIYANSADFDRFGQESLPVLQRGESYRAEFEFRRKDGSVLWGIINGKALNPDDLSEGVLFIVLDISPRKRAEDQLRDMNARLESLATTDHLTGISNRRHVSQLLSDELDRSKRYRHPVAVILLDIDHFKILNDRYGHDVGDLVLKEVAALLKNTLRKVDTVARWGGEEFLVLCPATPPQDATRLAELLRLRIEMHDFQIPAAVTASFGVAGYSAGQSQDSLIKCADQALYQAKELRNCVRLFTPPESSSHPKG